MSSTATNPDELLVRALVDPAARRDPYGAYRELREQAPVFRSAMGPLVLTRYDDCLEALRDKRLGRGVRGRLRGELPMTAMPLGLGPGDDAAAREFFDLAAGLMFFADPPDHSRLRRLVSAAFTAQRVEALRPAVQEIVNSLLDRMAEAGEVDVMAALALPLPVTVIGDLIGVPPEDREPFRLLVDAAVGALDPMADSAAFRCGLDAWGEMASYFGALVHERRQRPTTDLLSALIAARDEGDALSEGEVIGTAILLFAAGFETTANLIGNGLLALLNHRDQLERWRACPALSRSAVEELLRWDSPAQLNGRVALVDTDVCGHRIDAGEFVIVLAGAANRDPARFRDPDVLDLGRHEAPPLSFGWGIHHCLGAALARTEADVAFSSLLARFPCIELTADAPDWRPTLTVRGLSSLPVSL